MSATPIRVLLLGADGRMGRAIQDVAAANGEVVISGAVDRGGDVAAELANADAVVDFTQAASTAEILRACVAAKKPLVTGTTGHSPAQVEEIQAAARAIAIVHSANFSVGVNALFSLTRQAAKLLGADFDLEIVETHHRLKKDAPSGTAKQLAAILCEERALDYARNIAHGREGLVGERPVDEIGIHAIRGGDVVGDHTVIFAGRGERLELTHRAASRETFAAGALRAASWVVRQPAGLYTMQDVLGLAAGA